MREVDYARRLFKYIDMDSPPVDLNSILTKLGVKLFFEDFVKLDGLALKSPKVSIIVVNQNLPETRMRFTIAHELGHLIMPHRKSYYVCISKKNKLMERSANKFAAELLMPQPMVTTLWKQYKSNKQYRVSIVAHMLSVSRNALYNRLRVLELTNKN